MEWRTVRKLITSANADHLVEALRGLDDTARAALAADVRAYSAQWSTELAINTAKSGGLWEFRRRRKTAALRGQALAVWVAGAACVTDAADVAAWLARDDINDDDKQVAPALTVLLGRDRDWRTALVGELEPMLDRPRSPLASLTLELVRHGGMEPPTTERFFAAWLAGCGGDDADSATLAKGLATAEMRDTMIRLWFTVPELAVFLSGAWPQALAILAGDGTLDRGLVVDQAIARLRIGGDDDTLHGVLRLCRAMELSGEEMESRVDDLVQLLVDVPTSVAEYVLDKLSLLDIARPLDAAILVETARIAFGRADAAIGEAQLAWIDAAIERRPADATALLAATARALAHPEESVRRGVIALLSTFSDRIDAGVEAAIREHGSGLSPELAAMLPIDDAHRDATTTPVVDAVTPEPAPIATVADLATAVRGLLDATRVPVGSTGWRPIDWRAVERVLAALVAEAHRDAEALATALGPIVGDDPVDAQPSRLRSAGESFALLVAAAAGRLGPEAVGDHAAWRSAVDGVTGPHRVILARLREITVALTRGAVPALVSTPTSETGHVDAATLVRRLTEAAAADWQPLDVDLQLALLRLPNRPQPDLARTARTIDSAACARLAAALDPQPTGGAVAIPHARTGDDPQENIARLLVAAPGDDVSGDWAETWPSLWPSDPEAVAAWSLPRMTRTATTTARGAADLVGIGEATDALGPVAHRLVALGLSASDNADRDLAVATLVRLAKSDAVDAAVLGRAVAELTADGTAKLTRVVPALTRAAEAGAGETVFAIVSRALPGLLPGPDEKPVNRLADLVALGCDTAAGARTSTEIPELAAFAQRRASSKLVKEARRLHSMLAESGV